MTDTPSHEVPHRLAITVSVMAANIMQALDTTIANVALPHMQGSLSASLDQIEWVLTSYIVAAAIMTPPAGWLMARFGRKRFLMVCIIGFTLTSVLCGIAQTLNQMVAFRILQGLFGGALMPLSQAVMLDIYPKERHGTAMSIWVGATTLGPILGPTLGGWITDHLHWRWVFYINVPVGVLAGVGAIWFLAESPRNAKARLDWFGFAMLSVAVGAFQLMLDRAVLLDWFNSDEIVTEAVVAALAFYLFVTHTLTADEPFLKPRLFADRNFMIGVLLLCVFTGIYFSTLALMTPFLQNLMGYPVVDSGLLQAPRAIGSAVAIIAAGRLLRYLDLRLIMLAGGLILVVTLWQMTGFTADVSASTFLWNGVIQGFGLGFIFVPITTFTFSTLPAHDRPEATGLFALLRNFGASVSISVLTGMLTTNIQVNHAHLAEYITPTNRLLRTPGILRFWNPLTHGGIEMLDREITKQATTLAFISDFRLLMVLALASLPLLLLLRIPRNGPAAPAVAVE